MSLIADIILCVVFIVIGYAAVCCRLGNHKFKEIKPSIFALNKNRIIYLIVVAAAGALLISMFQIIYKQTMLQQLKLLSIAMILFPVAAVDFKTKTIPNLFLIAALIVRVIIFVFEYFESSFEAIDSIKAGLIAAVGVTVIFGLVLIVSKNSIGAGDIKLFAVMGLYQGVWGLYTSLFFSLLISFFVSMYFLITKKKKKKDVIAFGPCIAIGTVIAMSLSGI